MSTSDLTAERLRELLHYDPETGVFTWRVGPVGSVKVGDVVGFSDRAGYLRTKIAHKSHALHRLAWLYVYGTEPDGEIDHINGIRDDNRLCNLRVVTRTENVRNRRKTWSSSGYVGVSKNGSGWRAALTIKGKMHALGTYKTPEEAYAVYVEAKKRLHGVDITQSH